VLLLSIQSAILTDTLFTATSAAMSPAADVTEFVTDFPKFLRLLPNWAYNGVANAHPTNSATADKIIFFINVISFVEI
jgi:hypothetical protein